MNNKSNYRKSTWANGQPSIQIEPYDYSELGFRKIINVLQSVYRFNNPYVIREMDKLMTNMIIKDEIINIDMDNWTCSISFQSDALRDEVFALLKRMKINL